MSLTQKNLKGKMMKAEIVQFDFRGSEVRVIDENGEPWFVAKDVCECLGLSDTNKALLKLDEDEKLTRKVFGSGQGRNMMVVSESGLYSLIFRSNKPEAKVFKKWVTSEVLPSIRKTGGFQSPRNQETLISPQLIDKYIQSATIS